jgi:6-phosphofructokinase 1
MPAIRRVHDAPYRWGVVAVDAAAVANLERSLPEAFVRADGLHVSAAACDYIRPLIEGEAAPPLRGGLPDYGAFAWALRPRSLARWPG